MNFFYRYVRSKTIHPCKSYTKSFFSTLFVVFCFEITFKIVKMRSISAVDFFSYEFVNGVTLTEYYDIHRKKNQIICPDESFYTPG